MPPSSATSQYPCPYGVTAPPTIGPLSGTFDASPKNRAFPLRPTAPFAYVSQNPPPLGVENPFTTVCSSRDSCRPARRPYPPRRTNPPTPHGDGNRCAIPTHACRPPLIASICDVAIRQSIAVSVYGYDATKTFQSLSIGPRILPPHAGLGSTLHLQVPGSSPGGGVLQAIFRDPARFRADPFAVGYP